MLLTVGARLGPYEIVAPIGAGGMGEVYKATDTRLDRAVAVKILPAALAVDPEFRQRFDREARAISQLTHAHICTLHDVGDHDGTAFLVMELLDGETLAARLDKGALPPAQALAVAIQIASALDAAHRHGIVHRDLKPGNVMLTKAGAKLLDFGLAKASRPAIAGSGLSMLPTTPANLTAQGTILGTFQYMAPEQIEGQEADARSDIFAFGAVLYEMMTGRKAFEGKTRASLLGAILKDEPPPMSAIQPIASAALDRIVRTCLAKDPEERWQSARDLLRELTWAKEGAESAVIGAALPVTRRASRVGWVLAGAFALTSVAAGIVAVRHVRETPAEPIQFTIPLPENSVFGQTGPVFAVSPDGRSVVFVTISQGTSMLWLRSLGSLTASAMPGTDGARFPFWSPDSRFVAFFAGGKLKKVPITGGPPIALCDVMQARGGSWGRENVIVFAPAPFSALQRVSAAGGTPAAATSLDGPRGEVSHRYPHFLPDGRYFVYTATRGLSQGEIRTGSVDSTDTTSLVGAGSNAAYGSGHLFFWRAGSLLAQRFDPDARQLNGDPFPVAEQVSYTFGGGTVSHASFAVSPTGVLIYARGDAGEQTSRLTWMDRAGKTLGTAGEPGEYFNLALAPDERRIAVSMNGGSPPNRDIWVIDLARSVSSRRTFGPDVQSVPAWSPDGGRVLFRSVGGLDGKGAGLFQRPSAGGGEEELLLKSTTADNPTDWSRDGRFVVYTDGPASNLDLWILPLSGDRKPLPFLATPFNEDNGVFSPDGHWLAYSSNETSRDEIYVRPFPVSGGQYQVSRNGGLQPMWRGDGKELYFLAPDSTLMAASIDAAQGFEAGVPKPLFLSGATITGWRHQYVVTRDGQRFLVNVPQQRSSPTPLTVVVNWTAAAAK